VVTGMIYIEIFDAPDAPFGGANAVPRTSGAPAVPRPQSHRMVGDRRPPTL